MKANQVARRIGVSPRTVYNHSAEPLFQEFLSDGAKHQEGKQATFTDDDVIVLHTISELRSKRVSAVDVAIKLHEGYRNYDMPANAVFEETMSNAQALALKNRYDQVLQENQELKAKIETLQAQRMEDAKKIGQAEEVERLREQAQENAKQMGRLQVRIEIARQFLPDEYKKLLDSD